MSQPKPHRTKWNDQEDEALDYLPHVDQVIYLRGIRRRMDYATGVAGVTAPLSYGWLSQLLEVIPEQGSHLPPPPRLNKSQLRASFGRLERAGLVERVRDHGGRGLVFRCLLADAHQSVQDMNDPRTTPERPQVNDPIPVNNNNDLEYVSDPGATPSAEGMNDPIQESGYLVKEKNILSGKPDVARVVDHLNEVTGSKFEISKAGKPTTTAKLAAARISDYGVDKIIAVIDSKNAQWPPGDPMRKYLRPSTLFGMSKCEEYVAQLSAPVEHLNPGASNETHFGGRKESRAERHGREQRELEQRVINGCRAARVG